jgi:hypothetical protein
MLDLKRTIIELRRKKEGKTGDIEKSFFFN